ncbi:hypothetical protein AKJ56_02200 [candidate division MSBL1 archaeon SCGC-AAA382N08]|uniref:Uncharacterized protein n=1 Tax=candidate division MSBL1 archaeon SCGC-AAA382N08 TaxID=1698285 RepID=A0A133VN66_9EURY|nr:hypothetical protein AKJ56_02200 [candidate division MSBL1 archaeon SCGC-AAA382N08]
MEKERNLKAKALEDLVVTEKCPVCGRVHKWIWPKHPPLGEKESRKCGGKEITIEIIPKSEYEEPKDAEVEDVVVELLKQAKDGDIKAKKALKKMNRLSESD